MSKGYVYILSNPSMPGLVKIGMTTGEPSARAGQLQTTGVPTPFVLESFVPTPDCAALEAIMHDEFSARRVDPSREFFRVELREVEAALEAAQVEQLRDFVGEYTESYVLTEEPFFVDPSTFGIIAQVTGCAWHEVVGALEEIRCDDVGLDFDALLERYRSRRDRIAAASRANTFPEEAQGQQPRLLQ